MVLSVDVEEEVYNRTIEAGSGTPVEGEAGAGNLDGAFEIEDAEFGAEVPMGLGFEIELCGFAGAAHLDVIVGRFSDGDRFVRDVGDAGEERLELVVDGLDLFVQGGDLIADVEFFLALGGIAFTLEFTEFDGLLVLRL